MTHQPRNSTLGYWVDHGTLQPPNAVPTRNMFRRDISDFNKTLTGVNPLPGLKHSACLDQRPEEVASDIIYYGNDVQCSMFDTPPLPSPSSFRSNTQKPLPQTGFHVQSELKDNFSSTVRNAMFAPLSDLRNIPRPQEIGVSTSQSNLDQI